MVRVSRRSYSWVVYVSFATYSNSTDSFTDLLLTLKGESLIVGYFNNHFTDRPHEPGSILLTGFLGNNSLSQFNAVRSSCAALLDLVLSGCDCGVTPVFPGFFLQVDPYHPRVFRCKIVSIDLLLGVF